MTAVPLRSAAELLPLLPELVLVGGAFALLMLDLFLTERSRVATHLLSIALLLVVAAMTAFGVGGQGTALSGMFVRDGVSDALSASLAAISALADRKSTRLNSSH